MPLQSRPVEQIDGETGLVIAQFQSVYAAATTFYRPRARSVMVGNIGCCKGRQKTAYGFEWRYTEEGRKAQC